MLLTEEDLRNSEFEESINRSIWDTISPCISYSIRDYIRDYILDSILDSIWGTMWPPIRNCIFLSVWNSISRRLRNATN